MAPQIISTFPRQSKKSQINFDECEKGPVELINQDALSADTKS